MITVPRARRIADFWPAEEFFGNLRARFASGTVRFRETHRTMSEPMQQSTSYYPYQLFVIAASVGTLALVVFGIWNAGGARRDFDGQTFMIAGLPGDHNDKPGETYKFSGVQGGNIKLNDPKPAVLDPPGGDDAAGHGDRFVRSENLKNRQYRTARSSSMTEDAVDAGLRWLARHQDADGSWSPENFTKNCQGGTPCENGKGFGSDENRIGATGLALLAFLGAGHDHRSLKIYTNSFTNKTVRVGEVVKRGLLYLKEMQLENGSLVDAANSKWGYNHSLGVMALSEAYGLSRAPQWKTPAQLAVNYLVAGQNTSPGGTGLWGWRYRPNCGDNDISVTGWAVMALKSAEMSGLRVPQESFEGALQFCDEVTDRSAGLAGYMRREDAGIQVKSIGKNEGFANHPSLAAVGMCVRTFIRHNIDDPTLETSAKQLVRDLPLWDKTRKMNDYYYWYYATLALNQFDGADSPRAGKGSYWNEWNAALQRTLVENQINNSKICSHGSWDGDDRWSIDGGGRVYATAINTLNFEVYYRYANTFGAARKPPAPNRLNNK